MGKNKTENCSAVASSKENNTATSNMTTTSTHGSKSKTIFVEWYIPAVGNAYCSQTMFDHNCGNRKKWPPVDGVKLTAKFGNLKEERQKSLKPSGWSSYQRQAPEIVKRHVSISVSKSETTAGKDCMPVASNAFHWRPSINHNCGRINKWPPVDEVKLTAKFGNLKEERQKSLKPSGWSSYQRQAPEIVRRQTQPKAVRNKGATRQDLGIADLSSVLFNWLVAVSWMLTGNQPPRSLQLIPKYCAVESVAYMTYAVTPTFGAKPAGTSIGSKNCPYHSHWRMAARTQRHRVREAGDISDDDDDDVVMLTNSEKSKQELDDLEYARRLQAQFDEEQTRGNGAYGPLPDPRLADPERGNTSARRVTFADSPLPERSERLLQAVGASPALTQFLGSPRSTQAGASLTELADVEQRLELLRQLALQNEFIDDAVITEILGVPTPPPEPGSNRGPRPPSQRPSRRESAGTTSRGAVGYQQASNTFQRALLGLGMNAGEDASYESLLELADRIGDARQAGLEPEVIDQLPCRTYKEEEARGGETECRICMSDFEKGQRLRTLNCFHEYHSACIDKWLQRNASCPICRERVTFD